MSSVFSHGRLRLYLLKLVAAEPHHGYELIRLLENRFLGRYAPSAGTIYPRLQRMETDGLVTHTATGGRKVYEITEAGRRELIARAAELAALETEIDASVADLSDLADRADPSGEVDGDAHGSVRTAGWRSREATRAARTGRPRSGHRAPGATGNVAGGRDAGDVTGGRDAGSWRPTGAPFVAQGSATAAGSSSAGSSSAGSSLAGSSSAGSPVAGSSLAGSPPVGPTADLEQRAEHLLDEVRRLARAGGAGAEAVRATAVILDAALDQVRRLLR